MRTFILRLVSMGQVLVWAAGCGVSVRAGPKATVHRGDVNLQGEGTLATGVYDSSYARAGIPDAMLGLPVTLAAGSTLDGRAEVHLESGAEWSRYGTPTSWFGYRLSPRFGGALVGRTGTYGGVRGGPLLCPPYSRIVLSLEALANLGLSGEMGGFPTLGGVFAVGWDQPLDK